GEAGLDVVDELGLVDGAVGVARHVELDLDLVRFGATGLLAGGLAVFAAPVVPLPQPVRAPVFPAHGLRGGRGGAPTAAARGQWSCAWGLLAGGLRRPDYVGFFPTSSGCCEIFPRGYTVKLR